MSKKRSRVQPLRDADTFMNELDHPHKEGINRLRTTIRKLVQSWMAQL
ncbi:MAG: hypothetical protein K9G39_05930 [Chlorobium sp.]|nr:hypothetical protein [Chlorobium sp.]MCF8383121.1 hypothetical protein [Chlorobium sp.]